MQALPPYKFIEHLARRANKAPRQIIWSDLVHRMQECGYLTDNENLTPLGRHALQQYEKSKSIFRQLALDLVEQLSEGSDMRTCVPMCGYAIGFAKDQGWVVENEQGILECTILGLTSLSAGRQQ